MSSRANDLVAALAAARKATQFYPHEHPRYLDAIEGLVVATLACVDGGQFVLNAHQGRLYSGSEPLSEDSPGLASIIEAMEARRIESLTFLPGFSPSDARGLTDVLSLRPSPELDIRAELNSRDVNSVQVAEFIDEQAEEREERDRDRERDRAMYRRFMSVMRRMSERMQRGADPDLSEVGGMVSEIMTRLMDNQAAVLGLATLKSHDEEDLNHSINVMIYALTIGAALDLPEEGFASLGVSALTHDIGKAVFDKTPEEAERIRVLHPETGAEILSRLPTDDRAPMLVAYEHHMGIDASGWPDRCENYVAHPFSRMVSIADRYERLTKSEQLTPDRAVAQLLSESGTRLDPIFTRLFVQALGVFPVGCWVRLSDHSVAVVSDRGEDAMKPHVRVVFDATGLELKDPQDIDLGCDERDIVEVVNERQISTPAAEHL
jgi:HD-GYP domain-containing protein (c-di-GMP phosphodiesterase class II)